ncbi:hypothetical protein BT69DRAFT_295124 [Atractiella rhizophila]|nr:hypothetical protein BT69DRAFT_295124 [Atractiella rhizophila]
MYLWYICNQRTLPLLSILALWPHIVQTSKNVETGILVRIVNNVRYGVPSEIVNLLFSSRFLVSPRLLLLCEFI